MTLEYRKLTDSEVTQELSHFPQWGLEGGQLVRTFAFAQYIEGARFALKVAHVADELNHHPDILIGYRKVRISVNTHDVGGISPYDFELARRLDPLT